LPTTPAIYGTEEKSAAQAALEFLSIEVTKKPCLARLVERGASGFRNMISILLAPPVAKALADAGYTKQTIRDYVYEHAQVAPQRLAAERADTLGDLDRFRTGPASLKREPRLVVGIDHLGGARCDPDQDDPCTRIDVVEGRVVDLHISACIHQ